MKCARGPARVLPATVAALAIVLILAGAWRAGVPPRRELTVHVDRFNERRAWRLVELQLGFGQRPAGSAALRRLAERLRPLLPAGHFEKVPGRGLRNIVGTLPGRRPAIVVGAHYDVLADPAGFVGANNGAAGTAVVLEVARAMRSLDRPAGAREIRFVLFDGEEPPHGTPEQVADFAKVGLRGSRAYVAAHPGQTGTMILLDYVGNRGLRLPREGTSSPGLWRDVRGAAQAVGAGAVFPPTTGSSLIDDHTPFLQAGVPAVDLIDWTYPGHAVTDTIDKLSPASLDAVGATVVQLLREQDAADAGMPAPRP
jgi:glutaminyl-peptide cyclotransferase